MKNCFFLLLAVVLYTTTAHAQACTPAGDQTSYGVSDTWIGYVYDNTGFTNYKGYINEGSAGNPTFNETFGGDYVNLATNGCPVYTESFSVRYKLRKTFAAGNYQITVGGDDGYRLSLDGGATWVINRWVDQSYAFTTYAASLSGSYDIVLEYYENGGGNRVSFKVDAVCAGLEDQSVYGTGNVWRGYIYTGTNFNNYSGMVTEGSAASSAFNENFGGVNTAYATSACGVQTEQFSARYRLQKTFSPGTYTFMLGGDDGFRFSLDGGSTWAISQWWDQGYNTISHTVFLSGSRNMVIEYYENGGDNRISFAITAILPVTLTKFEGRNSGADNILNWAVATETNTSYYQVERSSNAVDFTDIGKTPATAASISSKNYSFTDAAPLSGVNYYRLRVVDKDGSFGYAAVIKINTVVKKRVALFPSVINHEPLYLKTDIAISNGALQLFDMTGKKLQQVQLANAANRRANHCSATARYCRRQLCPYLCIWQPDHGQTNYHHQIISLPGFKVTPCNCGAFLFGLFLDERGKKNPAKMRD